MKWLKKLFGGAKAGSDKLPQETQEIYMVAKCIGCGQCANGCPLRVKIKVPAKKEKPNTK